MKVWKIVTLIIVLGSITAPLVARLTTWLSPAVQAAMLAVVPPAAAAIVLVAFSSGERGWSGLSPTIDATTTRHGRMMCRALEPHG